jgi:DNA mismatch repair protein MLH3
MTERETKRIEKLPENTRTYLRSTQILTSIPQIVSELVQNSLDAQASHIDVGINCEEWTCFVSDDGVGISNEGLSMLAKGGEQGRYGERAISRL